MTCCVLLHGGQSDPPPITSDTIHPIDLKFGTNNKLPLYFQLNETRWCLTGFHGNNNQINDVTGGRHLGFLNFQILFKLSLLYLRLTEKQHLAVEVHETQKEHSYRVDGLINECVCVGGGGGGGRLISGWAYFRNKIFVGKWMGLYTEELKTGGGGL